VSWVFLAVAIAFEVAGTTSMKLAEGFTKAWPSILLFVFYGLSFVGATLALKELDVSIVYAIWSGVGTAAIAIIGFLMFKEPLGAVKLASIGLIVAGVVGLNIVGNAH
jgi:small multidrug resistance pump